VFLKDFNSWNLDKQVVHHRAKPVVYPKRRHIYYAKLGVNVGFEVDGKKLFLRPVLILARIGSLFWVAPLTSKFKANIFHYRLNSVSFPNIKDSVVMLSQARIVDKKRIQNELGIISIPEFLTIQKKMKKLYFPSF